MDHSTRGQRVTALVSTLVAVALLGAAVTAEHPGPAPSNLLSSLESDLRFQLDLAFRGDGGALNDRLALLEATLAAWRASPQSPADEQLLAAWYRESIQRSMPGRAAELPAPPEFGAVAAPAPKAPAPLSGGPRAAVALQAVPDAPPAPEPTLAPELAPRTSADERSPASEEAPADAVLQVSDPLTPAAPNPSAGPTITDMPRVIVSVKPVPEVPPVAVEPLEAHLEEGGALPATAVASGSPPEGAPPAPAAPATNSARPLPAPPLDAPFGEHSITVQRTTAPAPYATSYAEGAGSSAPGPAEVRIN
ncbi:MAG TPA: hypothetical protein VEQ85_07455, partial [Lacipirellulaceae bacterium]|nr:hypothetical protein [Lacipirellulaceae bacterium]